MAVVAWPDAADEIFGSDQAVAFGYVTPAKGVVVTPMTNFGVRDRTAGTLSALNASQTMWKRLNRLRDNHRVAVAYHTRAHSFTDRDEYVLVQGSVSLSDPGDQSWMEQHRDDWKRFAGPPEDGLLWRPLLNQYAQRVVFHIAVHRVTVWPSLECGGDAETFGAPAAPEPASQRPPTKGSGPRVDHVRAARFATRRRHRVLGWVGSDGYPVLAPVAVGGTEESGIVLTAASGIVPTGSRRAGFVAHDFARYTHGQNIRKYTGWLESDDKRTVYAPHTSTGYRIPESRTAFHLVAGLGTWRGYVLGRYAERNRTTTGGASA